jgi:menaquinone-dependent protoporphyrinogen oxidase
MRVFIFFSTTEGHAQTLAQSAATRLTKLGHEVSIRDAAQCDQGDLAGCDAALLIASVHVGHYRRSFVTFARKCHDALNAIPTAFVSVSLSAAGDNPTDLAGLRKCVERLQRDTAWRPGAIHHAAGAMLFSAYGFLTKLAIKSIARQRGQTVNTSQDYDLTDYTALESFVDTFAARAVASTRSDVAAAQ